MKKVLLSVSALLFSLGLSAQGWTTTGAHDDFASASFYKNGSNLEGVVWWANPEFALTRSGDGKMVVTATNAGGTDNGLTSGTARYPLIGANFNDSNDNGTGTSFTVDLTTGANVQVDIENTHASKMVYMVVILEDFNGNQANIEPNISDVTTSWGDPQRKALNGFTLAPATRRTITIDLSSVSGAVGGLTPGTYSCAGPADCPTTSHAINPATIKTVLFQVNFGKDNIDLSEGDGDPTTETFIPAADCAAAAFTGDIYFHDFKIGSAISSVQNEKMIDASLLVYPNPTKDAFTVSFDATEGAEVSLSDIVGNEVFATNANAGSNKINVTTSNLTSGLYILNVTTENGRVARKVNIK